MWLIALAFTIFCNIAYVCPSSLRSFGSSEQLCCVVVYNMPRIALPLPTTMT